MKPTLFICVVKNNFIFAQNVVIGTTSPHPSAQLEVSSSNKCLLIPGYASGAIGTIPQPASRDMD